MSYTSDIRAQISAMLRDQARQHDAGGRPFVAAVYRECAQDLDESGAARRRAAEFAAEWIAACDERDEVRDELIAVLAHQVRREALLRARAERDRGRLIADRLQWRAAHLRPSAQSKRKWFTPLIYGPKGVLP